MELVFFFLGGAVIGSIAVEIIMAVRARARQLAVPLPVQPGEKVTLSNARRPV